VSESIDPRQLAAALKAEHGDQAASEALVRLAHCNADDDHAGALRWEQVFQLLMIRSGASS